jgi:hypothetical protein
MSLRAQQVDMATRAALYPGGLGVYPGAVGGLYGGAAEAAEAERRRRGQLYEMDLLAARSRSAQAMRSEADRIDSEQRRMVARRRRVTQQAAAQGRALQSRLADEQASTEAAAARAAAAAAERSAAEARHAYEAAAVADMRSLQLSAQLARDRELFGALANRTLKGVDVDLYDPLLDDLYVPASNRGGPGDVGSVYTHPWRPSYETAGGGGAMTWRGRKVRVRSATGEPVQPTRNAEISVLGSTDVSRESSSGSVGTKTMARSPSHVAALAENEVLREKVSKVDALHALATNASTFLDALESQPETAPAPARPASPHEPLRFAPMKMTAAEKKKEEEEAAPAAAGDEAGPSANNATTEDATPAAMPAATEEAVPVAAEEAAPAAAKETAPAAIDEKAAPAAEEAAPVPEEEKTAPAAVEEAAPAAAEEAEPAAAEDAAVAEEDAATAVAEEAAPAAVEEAAPAAVEDAALAEEEAAAAAVAEEAAPAPTEDAAQAEDAAAPAAENLAEENNTVIEDTAAAAVENILSAAAPEAK